MKKSAFLWLLMIWTGMGGTFFHTLSASNSYRDITLKTAGTLIDSLASGNTNIDSLIVRGPINEFDFSALRNIAKYNESFVINLAYADVENKTIPERAFYESAIRNRIRRIILPDDIHTIEDFAFQSLYSLTDINMPAGLRQLGKQVFYSCSGLSMDTLGIPEGMEVIPRLSFAGCTHLRHIVFPKSLKHIESGAFDQAFRIQSLTFQEGLESIEGMTFRGMGEIDTIRLPQSVTKIGEGAFAHNFSLKYINIPTGVTTIPVEFASDTELDSIDIPDNVITIEEGAFSYIWCTHLRLSQNLTTIERSAFYNNMLTDILLPASLQFIGNQAFTSGTVKNVYCPANIPPALESTDNGQWAFAGCTGNATLFVPVGCGDVYRNTPGWNNFSNIVETTDFSMNIDHVKATSSWTAMAGNRCIVLQNNGATSARLSIHALGGELIREITLQGRSAVEVISGTYLISDGQNGKTVFVK